MSHSRSGTTSSSGPRRGRPPTAWTELLWAWEAVYTEKYAYSTHPTSTNEAALRALHREPATRNSLRDKHGNEFSCEKVAARNLRERYKRFELLLAKAAPDGQIAHEAARHKNFVARTKDVLQHAAEVRPKLEQIHRDVYIGGREVPTEALDKIFAARI